MKKLLGIAALCAAASGCVMTGAPIASGVMSDVQYPDTGFIDNAVKPAKVGTATSKGILILTEGDSSLQAAMKNGGITKVHHVDYKVRNILGIVADRTTIVYGE